MPNSDECGRRENASQLIQLIGREPTYGYQIVDFLAFIFLTAALKSVPSIFRD
jgi:hypothetical protein